MAKPSTKALYSQALAEWRQEHFGELEDNLTVLKGIRDNGKANDKDRIEAAKGIARLLAGLSTERQGRTNAPGQPAEEKDSFPLSEEEKASLDKLISEAHGPTN